MFGQKTTIGLDLGATGARMVELNWQGPKPVIARWDVRGFSQEISDWRSEETGEADAAIRDMSVKNRLRGRWVSHAISGESVVPQYFNFPQILPEDVGEAVRIEVEAALPFPVNEAMISYVLFPDQRTAPGKVRTHGLAIAADGEFVGARLRPIRAADMETFCMETDSTAVANAYLTTRGLHGNGATAVINVGHRYTNLALLGPAGTLLIRDVPWGGAGVTRALSDALAVPVTEAERLKQVHWTDGPDAAPGVNAVLDQVLQSSSRECLERLHDTIEYWISERLVPPLASVVLTGGGSQIKGLPELMVGALGVAVERWAPALEAAGDRAEEIRPVAHRLSVAFGLALRRQENGRA